MKFFLILFLVFNMTINILSQSLHEKNNQVDELLSPYAQPKSPGASVMIIQNGEVLYKNSYGFADAAREIKVTTFTNFRLASVTKQFTAAAILILAEEKKLNLFDTLSEVFPGFPEYGKTITIKHLLNHTSGIVDYESLIPENESIPVKDKDVLDLLMDIDSVYFPPGERFKYSNSAYALLKLIIEQKSGKTFDFYLKEKIFKPLGMNTTVAYERGIVEVKNRAYGHSKKDNGWELTDQSMTSAVLGDGGVYSNIEDLFYWDQSLYSDKILPDDIRNESMTRKILNDGELFDYGYGWRLKIFMDEEVVYHTGSTIGGRTIIYRIPSKKFSIILLSNRNEGDTLDIAEKIAGIYLKK
jgi:CubicO group peptidase (beta-lactamase class C family)